MTDQINFAALTPRQRDVLGQIALNNDRGHSRRTLEALERKGLIVGSDEILGGRFPVRVRRHGMPIWAHIQWCEWCAENYKEGEQD